VLALVVPQHFPQHRYVSLNTGNKWNFDVCIPVQSGTSPTNVTFNWTSSDHAAVRLLVVPYDMLGSVPPIYNVTGVAGSGSYGSAQNYNEMGFIAVGLPTEPAFVNITLSYDLLGHYLGGPSTPSSC
jgi:hypothetical protein